METIFIYLLKSSSIVALVFLVYHFLLRKETFFTLHRWYLLIGLAVSIVLPLYFIKKIVYVEPISTNWEPTIEATKNAITQVPVTRENFEVDWFQIGFVLYGIVTILLLLKVIYDIFSLYKILRNREINQQEAFSYVDIDDEITPFSFFKYIVFNSKLYAQNELESIIAHEKIHSSQGHSYDVLIARLFTVLFWFNPFIYWYKKAILQNLEYIADQNAIGIINDKKSYQMTLLKVVSNQNCLSITNNFNQSLIKKRIVMLNKNQSHRAQVWKFAIVIPILVAFVFLFQVKTVAQEMYSEPLTREGSSNEKNNAVDSTEITSNSQIKNHPGYIFDKITTDNQLKQGVVELKEEFNIDFKYSNIKRNSKGEIIAIQLSFKTSDGKKGKTQQSLDTGIHPILFRAQPSADGKYEIGFYDNYEIASKAKNEVAVDESNLNIPPTPPATPIHPDQVAPVAPVESNETATPVVPQKPKTIIFSNDNGDDIVIADNYKLLKVPGSPSVELTNSSPVLIIDGKVQSNPKATIEKIDVTTIKSVRVYDEYGKESQRTPIKMIMMTTK
jgi:Zn-dependent protease with chaperone function